MSGLSRRVERLEETLMARSADTWPRWTFEHLAAAENAEEREAVLAQVPTPWRSEYERWLSWK